MPSAPNVSVTITNGSDPAALARLEQSRDTIAVAEILERHLPPGTPSATWLAATGELTEYVAAQRAQARRP